MYYQAYFRPAIEKLGVTKEVCTGWMLPDGLSLIWPNQDHRWCGQWCSGGYENWTEFIYQGAASVFISGDNISIRTSGLTSLQRIAFENFYAQFEDDVLVEMYWEQFDYIGRDITYNIVTCNKSSETILDPLGIRLKLTDPIAYEIYKSEQEEEKNDD